MIKKFFVFVLVGVVSFSLMGCNANHQEGKNDVISSTSETSDNNDNSSANEETSNTDTSQEQDKNSSEYEEEQDKGDPVNTLYSITEHVSCENNLFKYADLWLDEYNKNLKSIVVWVNPIKNISNDTQYANVRIKFYDADKKMIFDCQHRDIGYASNFAMSLDVGRSCNVAFTFYDDMARNGYYGNYPVADNFSFKDVKYFSVEDIDVH